jgi:hypothetical protein
LEIPTVSLHVHERIDPRSIIEAVRKKNGEDFVQGSLFSLLKENPPLREAIEFYKHAHNWSNRLVAALTDVAVHAVRIVSAPGGMSFSSHQEEYNRCGEALSLSPPQSTSRWKRNGAIEFGRRWHRVGVPSCLAG